MNPETKDLSARFQQYRRTPRIKVQAPVEPEVRERPHYPTDGYLSNAETHHERFLRVQQAHGDGFLLGPLDKSFLYACWWTQTQGEKYSPKTKARWAEQDMDRALKQGPVPTQGGNMGAGHHGRVYH